MRNLFEELQFKRLIIDNRAKTAHKINEKMTNKFLDTICKQEMIISQQQKEIESLKVNSKNETKISQFNDLLVKNANSDQFSNSNDNQQDNNIQQEANKTRFINAIENIKKQIQDTNITSKSPAKVKATPNKEKHLNIYLSHPNFNVSMKRNHSNSNVFQIEECNRNSGIAINVLSPKTKDEFNGTMKILNEALSKKGESEDKFEKIVKRENKIKETHHLPKKIDLQSSPDRVNNIQRENKAIKKKNFSISVEKSTMIIII